MKSCPKCKSNMIIDIVYGYPGDKLLSDASESKVKLGGCVIWGDDPEYTCKSCGYNFSGLDDINDDL